MLRGTQQLASTVNFDHVLKVISLDQQVASFLFRGFQKLEWSLRSLLVEKHCSVFPSTSCFLEESHYLATSFDNRPTHEVVRQQILRMREPYIIRMFSPDGMDKSDAFSIEKLPLDKQEEVLHKLPIWSVVDGWSFGVLVRSILGTRPWGAVEEQTFLWKEIAAALNTANTQIHGQLQSLIVLRNQVAHHSRLWMKTTTNTSKMPKKYTAQKRKSDPKSMNVSFMTLCLLLEHLPDGKEFASKLVELVDSDDVYARGIRKPLGE